MHFINSSISGSFIVDSIMLSNILFSNGFFVHATFDDAFFIRLFYYITSKDYLQYRLFFNSQEKWFSLVR